MAVKNRSLLFLACVMSYAIAFQPSRHSGNTIDLASQCPAPGLAATSTPAFHTEAQCPQHGPCYGDGDAEFCVFTATAQDNSGQSAVLPVVTARGRAPAVLQVLSHATDAEIARHDGRSSPQRHAAAAAAAHAVVPVPGKGLGVVATGALRRGDRILRDAPALVVDHCAMASVPQYHLARLLNEAAGRLSGVQRDRIMRLAVFGDEAPDAHYLVGRIYATSAYMLDSDGDDMFGDGCGIGALFPEGMLGLLSLYHGARRMRYVSVPIADEVAPSVSRINHACRPNAAYHFNPESAKMEVHAVRSIAAGEEITVSYIRCVQNNSNSSRGIYDEVTSY